MNRRGTQGGDLGDTGASEASAANVQHSPASEGKAPRTARGQRTLRKILDAAEAVFARKGFHDATVKEIAAAAEFSVGGVYSFFEDKDDLFVQIYLRRGAEFMAGMRAVLAAKTTPRAALHEHLVALPDHLIHPGRGHRDPVLMVLHLGGNPDLHVILQCRPRGPRRPAASTRRGCRGATPGRPP